MKIADLPASLVKKLGIRVMISITIEHMDEDMEDKSNYHPTSLCIIGCQYVYISNFVAMHRDSSNESYVTVLKRWSSANCAHLDLLIY